jgi:hypothetical protein
LEQGRVCFEHKDHRTLNINRQAGRRRGRGGQRQGGGGNPNGNNGNRIDNRARGNANQLYEKYKALATEAQRQGDRVNTEYYLQFADHYFRVLAESRSRFEEQNPNQNQQRRGREDAFDDDEEGYEDDGAEGETQEPRREIQAEPRRETRNQDRDDRGNRQDRGNREPRDDRGNRYNGNGNVNGNANVSSHANNDLDDVNSVEVAEVAEPVEDRAERPSRRGLRPRREPRVVEASEGETFDASLLPPALGISAGTEGEEEVAPKPRRRRTPRATEPAADAAE